jgi:hypothetical protein
VTDTYRWVVDDSVTAAAIAESAQYIEGVDVDAALAGFDKAAAAVLHVNTTRPDAPVWSGSSCSAKPSRRTSEPP